MQTISQSHYAADTAHELALQGECYGTLDTGDGVPIEITEAVCDTWFAGLQPQQKAALFIRQHFGQEEIVADEADVADEGQLGTCMLRNGLAQFCAMVEEHAARVHETYTRPFLRRAPLTGGIVLPTMRATADRRAHAYLVNGKDFDLAERTVVPLSLHPREQCTAIGVGELRHGGILPAAPVKAVEGQEVPSC